MSNSNAEFAENSIVDVLIPEASSVDIEEALAASETARDEDDSALITSITQRNLLFFDETLPVYVVLRTPYQDESQLKVYISRLHIVLEAHAISSPSSTAHSADPRQVQAVNQPRDVIWSGKIDVLEDPIIVVEESEEGDEDGQAVLVIWKLTSFLTRPRIRLQSPAVMFKLSASLQSLWTGARTTTTDTYLPKGIPLQSSLLQSLQGDPALRGVTSRLAGTRAPTSIASMASMRPETLPLKTVSKKAIPILPAINARTRYHRSSNIGNHFAVIASLDIEVPSFSSSGIELHLVKLQLTDGEAEDLVGERTVTLPITCRPRDITAFLYRLTVADTVGNIKATVSSTKMLEIAIDVEVIVSSACRPKVQMRWKTNVDFSTALNPNFGKPGQSMQRNHRPMSLPTPMASTFMTNRPVPSTAKDSFDGIKGSTSAFTDPGITVTFTAAKEVYVGEPFCWEVFIVNRSNRSRTLAVVFLPDAGRLEGRKTNSRPSSSYSNSGSMAGVVADAVVDENLLYAAMKAAQNVDPVQLVCLTTDINIGPLPPGSCYATEVEFLPLAKGFLRVEAVRIVDVTSNETIDIQDLPDIEALDRASDD
ncbi:hypothetical protein MMC13_004628 [Lambiella insularis]|nr:hypothetical protein [Lambiella insularis]